LAVAVAPYAAGLGFAGHDGPSLVDWLTELSVRPDEFALLRSRNPVPGGTATADGQLLLIRSEEVPATSASGVKIRMTAVARQRNPRQAGPRRFNVPLVA
jgi:hypothetical protein